MAEVIFKKPKVVIEYLSVSRRWGVRVNNKFHQSNDSLTKLLDLLVEGTVISEDDKLKIMREFEGKNTAQYIETPR